MAEKAAKDEGKKKGGGIMPLAIGLALAIVGGAGGFYLANAGMLPLPEKQAPEEAAPEAEPVMLPATDFVSLTPLIVTVGEGQGLRQLQLTAQLEVAPGAVEAVTLLSPRIVDVLNTYLRAVDAATVEDPAAMLRMRAQMLRRVQVVTGEGMVRDLLVSEFILR